MITLVTYRCGHSTAVSFNPQRIREAAVHEQCRHKVCRDCAREHFEKKDQAKLRLASQQEQQDLLPELKGTERQITWARKIRWSMLYGLPDWVKAISQWAQEEAQDTHLALMSVTSSKWWIDHRGHQGKDLAFAGLAQRLWGDSFRRFPYTSEEEGRMLQGHELDEHGKLRGIVIEDRLRSTRGRICYEIMDIWLDNPTQDALWTRRREEIWGKWLLPKPCTWWWEWHFLPGRMVINMAIEELYGKDAIAQEPMNQFKDEY